VTVPENMDAIHSMIFGNRRISAKKIAEIPVIVPRKSRLYYSRDFRRKKTLIQMGSKYLNADQNRGQVLASHANLDRFCRMLWDFLNVS
jgi:hypothetical protein